MVTVNIYMYTHMHAHTHAHTHAHARTHVCMYTLTLIIFMFQVPSFGLAACNLQNDAINWGITFLLHGIQAHIYASPEHSLSNMTSGSPSLRMTELGQLMVGRIRGQLHIRNPEEYFPSRQLQFLLKADALQRRLYFLWPAVHPIYCVSHSLYDSESVCGCFGGCLFFDSTLEKNKYFVQLQQEHVPCQAAAAAGASTTKHQRRVSIKRNMIDASRDEPDHPPLQFSGRNSIVSQYLDRRGSLLRQRHIPAGENPISTPSGVTHIHTTLGRLSRRNAAEDYTDYSSMMTLNRNSLNSLNNKIVEAIEENITDKAVETKDDEEERITSSSSAESFMSALSQLDSDIEEPSEKPQPVVTAKELPTTWASTVTFCPYIISTRLSTQQASIESSPPVVTILCPRYRNHLPSLLPKVSVQLPSDEVPASPVVAKVSVNIQLVEKCLVRLTPSVLDVMQW